MSQIDSKLKRFVLTYPLLIRSKSNFRLISGCTIPSPLRYLTIFGHEVRFGLFLVQDPWLGTIGVIGTEVYDAGLFEVFFEPLVHLVIARCQPAFRLERVAKIVYFGIIALH